MKARLSCVNSLLRAGMRGDNYWKVVVFRNEYTDDTPMPATIPGDPSGFLALIGLFNDPDSPGAIGAKHDTTNTLERRKMTNTSSKLPHPTSTKRKRQPKASINEQENQNRISSCAD